MNSFLGTSYGRIAFLALFLMFLPTSHAQDGNAKSEELQEAIDEKKLAEAKRDKAVADKERRQAEAALAITAKTEPLKGTIAIDDNVKVEGHFLAYEALDKVAAKIAKNTVDRLDKYMVDWKKGVTFVLTTSENNTNAISLYWATMAQLKKAKKEYEKVHVRITSEPRGVVSTEKAAEEAAAIAAIGNDLGLLADTAALFRTDVSIKGIAVTFDTTATIATVAEALASELNKKYATISKQLTDENYKIIFDRLIFTKQCASTDDCLLRLLASVIELKNQVEKIDNDITKRAPGLSKAIAQLKKELAKLTDKDSKEYKDKENELKELSATSNKDKDDAQEIAKLKILKSAIEKLQEELLKHSAEDSLLPKLLRAENFIGLLQTDYSYVLLIKPVAGGGANRTKRNLLWTSLSHSGAAIATYFLTSGKDGRILLSGNPKHHIGFVKTNNRPFVQ